jgi:MSHA biogenesis protein MshK
MAQFIKNFNNRSVLTRLILLSSSALLSQPLMAENLPDPTRPPTMLMTTSVGAESSSGPILQSILIGSHRHVAIISGQSVALNEKYGDQILIRMSETEVVLRNGSQLQTLKLFPDFEKKRSHDGASLKTNTTRQ